MKERLQKFLQTLKLDNKTGYLIIIALISLLLLLLGKSFSSDQANSEKNVPLKIEQQEHEENEPVSKSVNVDSTVRELESSYEKDLKEMLEKINGVSDVEVMVNLDSTNVKVFEKNLIKGKQTTDETDQNGGLRKVEDTTEENQVVLVRQGDQEVPLLVQTKKPEVRGVFVVAKGVDHSTVKLWVVESVSRVLDVSTHKISVMPKK